MDKQLNIVWLPGWFPSRVNFLNGDFIERHAKAVSRLHRVTVLYVVKDVQLQNGKKEIVKEQTGNLTVYCAYYGGQEAGNIFNKIYSVWCYYKSLFNLYSTAQKENKKFDLCHVHVPLRQSLLALWLKWKHKINYVVSEHNSWYMPADKVFFEEPFFVRYFIKKIFTNASAVHVVSKSLGDELNKHKLYKGACTVIPNVVNTTMFKKADNKEPVNCNEINFIAITGDTWHKNTDGVIRSFAAFLHNGYKAKLHIVGPNIDALKTMTDANGMADAVIYYGAVSNEKVAEIMQHSDAMIFFTRFETFGCVMAEALCCGVPVIASRLPVLEENLEEGVNALFVESENEIQLTEKLLWFAQHKNEFDTTLIAEKAAQKYNYHTAALQFEDFYNKTCKQ